MKTYRTAMIALVFLAGTAYPAAPITEENAWTETYAVSTDTPRLRISNIWGSVRVRTGDAGQITLSVTELRSAPDQERFDRSLQVIGLEITADATGVSILVGDPDKRWHNMNGCDGCRVDYQFEVEVPPGATVDVGTVMDGRVDIKGITGIVSASNVNGPIRIDNLNDCESIVSVNGRIDLEFAKAPVLNCSIETINGDITLGIPPGTSLDMMLDLFNGVVESELQVDPYALPATVEHTLENGHNQYRIQKMTGVRLGQGGPLFSIASMNGDVRIQKHQ